MKNLLKITLLLSLIAMLFYGCSEDIYEAPLQDASTPTLKKITFEEFKNLPIYKKIPQYYKLKLQSGNQVDNSSNYIAKTDNDYVVYTDEIIESQIDGKTTYSLLIERNTLVQNKMYSIVFEEASNNQVKELILEYQLNSQDKVSKISKYSTSFEPIVEITPETPILMPFGCTTTFVIHTCSGEGHHTPFDDLPSTCPEDFYMTYYTVCQDSPGGDFTGGADPSGVFLPIGVSSNGTTYFGSGTSSYGFNNVAQHNLNIILQSFPNLTAAQQNSIRTKYELSKEMVANLDNAEYIQWLLDEMLTPYPILNIPYNYLYNFSKDLSLSQKNYLSQNLAVKKQIYKFLSESYNNQDNTDEQKLENIEFVKECIIKMQQNPTIFTSITPFIIEKNIDDSQLDPCAKNIISTLKTLSQNDIAKIIAKLGPTDSVYKVNIVSTNDLDPEDLGVTDWSGATPLPYQYTIQLNQQYMNGATQLSIASTVIHEIVHAYFLSLIDDNYETSDQTLNTFPLLWDYYVNDNGPGANIVQHNQMAQSYLNILACALQEFHTGIPLSTGTQPDQRYIDLAWGGLENTPPYNQLTENEKDRIQAINRAENTNSPQTANGTTYNPISNPCN